VNSSGIDFEMRENIDINGRPPGSLACQLAVCGILLLCNLSIARAGDLAVFAQPDVDAQPPLVAAEQFDRPVTSLSVDINPPPGEVPGNAAAEFFAKEGVVNGNGDRGPGWIDNTFGGHAARFCHRPLYFEETFLERYGHTHDCCRHLPGCDRLCEYECCCECRDQFGNLLQSAVSAAHFYGTVPLVPYKMATNPWCECVNTQGCYPAGHIAPRRDLYPQISLSGVAIEAGVLVGLIFLIP